MRSHVRRTAAIEPGDPSGPAGGRRPRRRRRLDEDALELDPPSAQVRRARRSSAVKCIADGRVPDRREAGPNPVPLLRPEEIDLERRDAAIAARRPMRRAVMTPEFGKRACA